MAKMGIQMIEMYSSLIREEFRPLIDQIKHLENEEKKVIEDEVRKELGIYDLWVKEAKLKVQLKIIEEKMSEWTKKSYGTNHEFTSPFDDAVNAKILRGKNGLAKEIRSAEHNMIKRIKLSGVTGDTAKAFANLPKVIKRLTIKLDKTLPEPKTMKQIQ